VTVDRRAARRFVRTMVVWIVALLAAIPAMNILMDPLGYARAAGWRPASPTAFELEKASVGQWPVPDGVREAKVLDVAWYRPDSVIYGSSTVWSYIDNGYPPLRSSDGRRAYNFGLAGGSFRELEMAFEHTVALRPPKLAVFGLEFYMFWADKPSSPGYVDLPFAQQPHYQWERARFVARRLLTADYTQASAAALGTSVWQWLGLFGASAHAAEPGSEALDTPKAKFRKLMDDNDHIQVVALYPPAGATYRFADAAGWSSLEAFRRMVAIARAHDVELRLYITPNHARELELIRMMGYWPQYQEWQRQLVSILDDDARAHAEAPPIPLWDFSGYNAITSENVRDDATPTVGYKFFADSFHFKTVVGYLIMDRIFGNPTRTPPDGFGVRLTPASIGGHQAEVDRGHEAYAAAHPDEMRALASTLRSINVLKVDPSEARQR
jgi:hypothetical protein